MIRIYPLATFAPGAIATRCARPAISTVAAVGRTTVAIASGTAVAAIATVLAITTITSAALDEGLGHQGLVRAGTDDLEPLGLRAGVGLRRQHGHDRDPSNVEVGVGSHDVANLGAIEQQGAVELTLGLLGTGGSPGPGAVFTATR